MKRANYMDLFSTPNDYKPPEDSEIANNFEYPNLNSKDYRLHNENKLKLYPFFETMSINDKGKIILGTNNIRGRKWNSSIWGFENIDDTGIQEKASFGLPCDSQITNIKFIQITLANGSLQLWSTKPENGSFKDYCLFMIGEKQEHNSIIAGFDIFPSNKSIAVTGSNNCRIKVWNTTCGDLISTHSINYAHSDIITGISCLNNTEFLFASCSYDKSAILWDYRLPRPATGIYDNHKYPFTAINYQNSSETQGIIMLGDETGKLFSVDLRVPQKFINELSVFYQPIKKISLNSKKIALIGHTNILKIYEMTSEQGYSLLYKDNQAKNFNRDIHWDAFNENLVFTIGWDAILRKHTIK